MDTAAFHVKPQTSPEREAFNERLRKRNAAPLWNVLGDLVLPEPRPASVPALWRYEDMRPLLMQFVNPATGGYPMPTIGAFLQLLPVGFRGARYRSTDATVYYVIEGRGQSQIGDVSLAWQQHDIFVVPSWKPVAHEAQEEAVLFSFSDRPVQKALGLWRHEEPATPINR